jgi:hypothetical protein
VEDAASYSAAMKIEGVKALAAHVKPKLLDQWEIATIRSAVLHQHR